MKTKKKKQKEEKVKFITVDRIVIIAIIVSLFWVPMVLDVKDHYVKCSKGVSSLFGGTYLEVDCSSPNVDVREDATHYTFEPTWKQFLSFLIIVFVINILYWFNNTYVDKWTDNDNE